MSDEHLLDFDKERLEHWDGEHAARLLQGSDAAMYRNHLEIAQWIDGWVDEMEASASANLNPEHEKGVITGVRAIAAHLRQADLLPDGVLLQGS
ncbi:hypothetical protein [Streptomyces violaceoruber]|nr:hypothetical protein [Streptomyces violaceoruber]